jgi:hypothetical protein
MLDWICVRDHILNVIQPGSKSTIQGKSMKETTVVKSKFQSSLSFRKTGISLLYGFCSMLSVPSLQAPPFQRTGAAKGQSGDNYERCSYHLRHSIYKGVQESE